jgi:hypothetical protein
MPAAPAVSCAMIVVERTRVTTSTPESPGIPARNGFTTYFALSSVTGLFCHRRLRTNVVSEARLGRHNIRELDASVGASGPHDFAVRCNISRPRAGHRSQVLRPALRSHRAQDAAASTAPRAYVRDDRETPLCVGRDAKSSRSDLGCVKTGIFLQRGLDMPVNELPDGQITPSHSSIAQLRDALPADAACVRERLAWSFE